MRNRKRGAYGLAALILLLVESGGRAQVPASENGPSSDGAPALFYDTRAGLGRWDAGVSRGVPQPAYRFGGNGASDVTSSQASGNPDWPVGVGLSFQDGKPGGPPPSVRVVRPPVGPQTPETQYGGRLDWYNTPVVAFGVTGPLTGTG